jgi:hypothetical protein
LAIAPGPAHAEPAAQLAALAPAPDARQSVAIGPAGEVYEPDGHGAWTRKRPIAIAGQVASGARAGSRVLALTHDGPPFRLAKDGWTVVHLGAHAKPLAGAGPRPVVAVGRTVFALDDGHSEPVKLVDAPAPVVALAASASGVVVETERGLARFDGKGWKPITGAPRHVAQLLSDKFALGDHGILDLRAQKTLDWPRGAHVVTAVATDDAVLAVVEVGKELQLVTARAGKLASEPVPVDAPHGVVGVAADRAGRAVVALRDGRLAVRDAGPHGTWSTVSVKDELPPPHPGSPPATSR